MTSSKIFIDAHIHIHDCYELGEFLNSAKINFEKQSKLIQTNNYQCVLCLSESHKTNFFIKLFDLAQKERKIEDWEIKLTKNHNTLILRDSTNFNIFIIAGRQIVTKEKLEVLALGLIDDPNDGSPIEDVIKYVNNNHAIPVIPWGVGKWIGKRKEIIEELLQQSKSYPIFFGDNGNRPFFWSKAKLFEKAEKNGILNLPGSDPLPFLNGIKKPGSFGFVLHDVLESDTPYDGLYKIIHSSKIQFTTYGELESFFYFMKNQISMQIVKRQRK